MDDLIKVHIVTPNNESINADTDFVVCKLDEGEYGFLKNHTPLIGRLSNGFIRYNDKVTAVINGIVDFNDNVLTCICQEACEGSTYDEAYNKLIEERERILKDSKRKLVDFTEAERDLVKALQEAKLGSFAKR